MSRENRAEDDGTFRRIIDSLEIPALFGYFQEGLQPAVAELVRLGQADKAAADETRDILAKRFSKDFGIRTEQCDRALRMCEWICEMQAEVANG